MNVIKNCKSVDTMIDMAEDMLKDSRDLIKMEKACSIAMSAQNASNRFA
jgi:hypothetical protein